MHDDQRDLTINPATYERMQEKLTSSDDWLDRTDADIETTIRILRVILNEYRNLADKPIDTRAQSIQSLVFLGPNLDEEKAEKLGNIVFELFSSCLDEGLVDLDLVRVIWEVLALDRKPVSLFLSPNPASPHVIDFLDRLWRERSKMEVQEAYLLGQIHEVLKHLFGGKNPYYYLPDLVTAHNMQTIRIPCRDSELEITRFVLLNGIAKEESMDQNSQSEWRGYWDGLERYEPIREEKRFEDTINRLSTTHWRLPSARIGECYESLLPEMQIIGQYKDVLTINIGRLRRSLPGRELLHAQASEVLQDDNDKESYALVGGSVTKVRQKTGFSREKIYTYIEKGVAVARLVRIND